MIWIYGILLGTAPLIVGELFFKHLHLKTEIARKSVHVLGAVSAVTMVGFLSLDEIAILSLGFLFVMLLIRKYKIIKSIYEVDRFSYGELLFPAGILMAAVISSNTGIFIAAVLILGFSDTTAGIVGGKYGKIRQRKLFSIDKTIAGSSAFLITTLIILLLFEVVSSNSNLGGVGIIATALAATTVEYLSGYGTDNLTIPMSITIMLSYIV